jgi:hypothetical protein
MTMMANGAIIDMIEDIRAILPENRDAKISKPNQRTIKSDATANARMKGPLTPRPSQLSQSFVQHRSDHQRVEHSDLSP